ncbi:MFS transporter [Clostridium sp. MT-14]|uniref:MFS transporter n=1 Tax=Clostridium sp. MT-14 TaxID=3348360 RepID=UPI0035F3217F
MEKNINTVSNKQIASATFASVMGWSLDLFDLFLILYVAPTVAGLFFPSKIQTLSLASVFAAFAVSVIVRPFGSAFFGNYADKWGRKRSMIITVAGVGIATSSLGILPTFASVGFIAPVLFLLIRILQGFFVGGVTASTHTIGTETVAAKWRGLMSGIITGGASIGALLASFVLFIVNKIFPGPAFKIWGWRCMFFSGLLCIILAIVMYKVLDESPLWLEMKQKREEEPKNKQTKSPLKILLSKKYASTMIINIMVVAGASSIYYLTSGYLPTFLETINKIPASSSAKLLMLVSVIAFISPMLIGQLSQVIGRKKTFLITGIACLVIMPFLYIHLAQAHDVIGRVLLFTILISALGNAPYSPVLIFLNERFPTEIRASGTAVSWNVGFAIGGLMPTFVTAVSPTISQIPSRLVVFLIIMGLIFIIGSILSPETKDNFN